MARWKARVRLPVRRNWTFFASSYRWGATRQNMSRLAAIRRGRSLGAKISGGRSRPWEIFWFLQNWTHFAIWQCKLHCVTCRRFDTIPACVGQTEGQTDGIAVASTALAKRRPVKTDYIPCKTRQIVLKKTRRYTLKIFGCLIFTPLLLTYSFYRTTLCIVPYVLRHVSVRMSACRTCVWPLCVTFFLIDLTLTNYCL